MYHECGYRTSEFEKKTDRTCLPQAVTARIQAQVVQGAIRLQIPMVTQTSRLAVVQMQRSTIETGSMSKSVSSLAKK